MQTLKKWNWDTRSYETYKVPDEWYVTAYENNMHRLVNCAQCGEVLPYGQTYTSREVHTDIGFGFAVCEKCNQEEFKRDPRYQVTGGDA